MDRRKFLTSSGALLAAGRATANEPKTANVQPPGCAEKSLKPEPLYAPQQPYRIGYTTNTRGGWEGDPFKGMREGREVGFRYMEIFGASFCRPDTLYYPDDAEGLMRRIFQMGVNFVSITGGSATGTRALRISTRARRWSRTTSPWPALAGVSVARCKRPTPGAGGRKALRIPISR